MRRGWEAELARSPRLDPRHLVEDAAFALPSIPPVDFAIAFAVFAHLPPGPLGLALHALRANSPGLRAFLFTVFLGPPDASLRQPDGVVTHPGRAPWHVDPGSVLATAEAEGFRAEERTDRLPRGQTLFVARPAQA